MPFLIGLVVFLSILAIIGFLCAMVLIALGGEPDLAVAGIFGLIGALIGARWANRRFTRSADTDSRNNEPE